MKEAWENNDNFASINFSKSDLFSLGLTILAMCDYQEFKKRKLNTDQKELENFIIHAVKKVQMPDEMALILKKVLQWKEIDRPDIKTLMSSGNLKILNDDVNFIFIKRILKKSKMKICFSKSN